MAFLTGQAVPLIRRPRTARQIPRRGSSHRPRHCDGNSPELATAQGPAHRATRAAGAASAPAAAVTALNVVKEGLLGGTLQRVIRRATMRRPAHMLHAGLDLSRKRLDYCLLAEDGEHLEVGAVAPDGDGLAGFARGVEDRHGPVLVRAAIESMNGARFVHDTLERRGWEVGVADAQKVKGLDRWPARPTGSTRGCSPSSRAVIWCRRSGCPASSSAPSASAPAGACSWCASAARSSTASTRSCWRSGTPARSRTCSGFAAGRSSRGWSSPSRGTPACLQRSR